MVRFTKAKYKFTIQTKSYNKLCYIVVGKRVLMAIKRDSKLWAEIYEDYKSRKYQKPKKTAKVKKRKKFGTVPKQERHYVLYVLQLEHNCWYIGITKNIYARFAAHKKGRGANWTRLHKPIKVFQTIEIYTKTMSEAAKQEDKLTLEYASLYGQDKVRGGGYCQTKPLW